MPQQRAPWWIYLLASLFLAYFAMVDYAILTGPEQVGMYIDYRDAGAYLRAIVPGSAGEQAGLKPGDHLVAVNGLLVHHEFDWSAAGANFDLQRPQRLEIERGGTRSEVQLKLEPKIWSWNRLSAENRLLFLWYPIVQIAVFSLALLIIFSRPFDLVARVGSALLATTPVGMVLAGPPYGFAVTWRHLPWPLGILLCAPHLLAFGTVPFFLAFCSIFPRRLFRPVWLWAMSLFYMAASLPFCIWSFFMIFQPARAVGFLSQRYLLAAGCLAFASILGSIALLILNYRRLTDLNERRRVRVLVTGTVIGWLGILIPNLSLVWAGNVVDRYLSPLAIFVLATTLFAAFPLSFAYAILRHRVFDIAVMIRQGLQYALARRVIVWAMPAAIALLVVDLFAKFTLLGTLAGAGHISEGSEILRRNLWLDGLVGVGIVLVYKQHQRWLEALDRRFFRERYDANRVLREVVEQLLRAARFEEAAPMVVARVDSALHPEFASLLIREPREQSFRTLASAPAGQAPPPLPVESKLLALVRVLRKPLEVPHTDSGWLQQQLPHEETDFLRRARIDLIVPVAAAADRAEALLVLGAKRSEEPYSRDDIDLLVAIASSLALLLERPAAPAPRLGTVFEECPQCGTCYDSGTGRCAQEGAGLVQTPLPRLLSDRYFLERRLGRGGMGTVYQATDRALERRVAAKVIRDDLVGSAEAAERFRREARAAASFTHPNVVTVFDFGVAGGTRAFLVMELLEGASLREALRRQGRMPAPRVLEILRGVSAAVEAAHRRQLVHRDLKPENIFLVPQETGEIAKVLDFGVAKFLPTDTQATLDAETGGGILLGTLRYMSPEQLRGEPADTAWDLWALTVVTYEMLTGKHPFEHGNPNELSRAIHLGRFTPIAAHLPDAPARWQQFFACSFALEAKHRPGSAGSIFAELESALA